VKGKGKLKKGSAGSKRPGPALLPGGNGVVEDKLACHKGKAQQRGERTLPGTSEERCRRAERKKLVLVEPENDRKSSTQRRREENVPERENAQGAQAATSTTKVVRILPITEKSGKKVVMLGASSFLRRGRVERGKISSRLTRQRTDVENDNLYLG